MHGDHSTCRRELDAIRQEVEDDLAVAPLVAKDLLKVVLFYWVLQDGPQQMDFLEGALRLHCLEAHLHEFDAVEILIHHREGVVVELSLVHQISHQGRHHFDLALHVLELLLGVHLLFELTFDHGDEEFALVYYHADQVPKLALRQAV